MGFDVDDLDGNQSWNVDEQKQHQLLRPPVVATLLAWSPPILTGKLA